LNAPSATSKIRCKLLILNDLPPPETAGENFFGDLLTIAAAAHILFRDATGGNVLTGVIANRDGSGGNAGSPF
jgi:hypothetical protein